MPESMWFFENKYILILFEINGIYSIQYVMPVMPLIKKNQKYGSTKNKNKL